MYDLGFLLIKIIKKLSLIKEGEKEYLETFIVSNGLQPFKKMDNLEISKNMTLKTIFAYHNICLFKTI